MPEPDPSARAKTETVARTLLVALLVSLVCSSFVASAAVLLQPRQVANAVLDVRRNILRVAGLYGGGGDVDELYRRIEPRIIELDSGAYVQSVDPETFDPYEAAKDSAQSVQVPPEIDLARIGRRSKLARVYLVRGDAGIDKVILPISGYGLWSTMYGFLALEADGNTIADITFYEHGETPGLGDFVGKPEWQALWHDKRLFDEDGKLQIQIIKGHVSPDDPMAAYRVDGVSGATLTGNGVTNLLAYWLGDHGYGPYLRRIREEGGGT